MPYPKTYRAIQEMILQTALYTPTARDIVRRAGLRPGGVSNPQRMGMLLVAQGSAQVPNSEGDTPVTYSTIVANDDGYTFTPGEATFLVPSTGLYRLTATLVMGIPSDEGIFGHAFVAGEKRAVLRSIHYIPPTTTPEPERLVLGGTAALYLDAGESAGHVFFVPESLSAATPGNIMHDSDASRLYVERVL